MSDVDLPEGQRILRRAVQLEPTRTGFGGGGLDAGALEAAAAELGVGPAAMAMALAESRAGVGASRQGLGERLVGPRQLVALRTSGLPAAEAERLVAEWLERGHVLRVSTRTDGSVVGRRRTDLVASAGRMVRSLGGEAGLSKVREVRGGVGHVSDGEVAVCVAADIADSRFGAVMAGSSVGTVALFGVGVGALAAGPLLLLASPAAIIAGVVTARVAHRDTVRRVREELDRTADAVATGRRPPALSYGFGRALGRVRRR